MDFLRLTPVNLTTRLTWLLAAGLTCVSGHTAAQEARFTITRYEVAGASKLPPDEVQRVLTPFTGPDRGFATIQTALKALEARYASAGFGAVRVLLPEQEVEAGLVRLRVVEGRLGKIEVQGNQHFSRDNVLASLPTLKTGDVPNMHESGASLRVANENGSKQTSLVFRPSEKDGEVDALLRVVDENPLKLGVSLDNTGSTQTGRYRLGFNVQHSNFLGLDHIASLQVITSPGHHSDVKVFGVGYRIPLYRLGDSIDLAIGYSDVNAGTLRTAVGDFGISGSGHVASAKYNIYLSRWEQWEHKLALGIDYRAYKNNIVSAAGGASLIPDLTVHPLTATYSGQWRSELWDFNAYITYAHNLAGGSNGSTADFNKPGGRQGASASFNFWRYGANLAYRLPQHWTMRMGVSGQHSDDLLIPGEMFGIGGADSVRGFYEREVANDRGYRGSLELYTPDWGQALGAGVRAQALVFYDTGRVWRNRPLPGEQHSESIASTGLGLRLGYARNMSFKLDYGVVTQGTASRRAGEGRVHGSLMWVF